MYEGLASYFLPSGVLEYFELTDYEEITTRDKGVLYTTELHIYLYGRGGRLLPIAFLLLIFLILKLTSSPSS